MFKGGRSGHGLSWMQDLHENSLKQRSPPLFVGQDFVCYGKARRINREDINDPATSLSSSHAKEAGWRRLLKPPPCVSRINSLEGL